MMKNAISANQSASRRRSSLRCGSMAERSFTPDEANNALAEVRPVAERLVAVRARMRELEHSQGELVIAIGGNGGGRAGAALYEAPTALGRVGDSGAPRGRQTAAPGARF